MSNRPGLDLLVTGFGPFPHVRVNPTARLARLVAGRLSRAGLSARAAVLETSYAGGLPALARETDRWRPSALLLLGLAGRARFVRVERFARRSSSRLHPDAGGAGPSARAVQASDRPLKATAAVERALACLRRAGIAARPSPSAGRYLCNAAYALALTGAPAGRPVLFVHVPWLRPEPGLRRRAAVKPFRPGAEALAAALAACGRDLVRQARARRASPSED